jgi:rubrerythrin
METKLRELIETAIKREEEAHSFYMQIVSKVSDTAVKETIEWIAGEERKHKKFLEDYRDGRYGEKLLRSPEVVYYKIAEHEKEPEVSGDMNSADVFLVAAHRERRSNRFYSELADQHAEGDAKDMLLRMAKEELRHKEKMEYLYANAAFPQTSGG